MSRSTTLGLPLAALLLFVPLGATNAAMPPAEQPAQTRSLYLQLIHQARADGRPRAAIAYLDDFDRQYPGDLDARLLRINSLLDLGQVDLAEAALARMPSSANGAAIDAMRGHVQAARGHWTQAVPCYQAALTTNPTDPLLRNALGYALLRAGRTAEAVEQLRGAVDLAPGDKVIRNNLILALAVGGNTADVSTAISQLGDRQAQADLRRQIAAEAARIATPQTPTEGS